MNSRFNEAPLVFSGHLPITAPKEKNWCNLTKSLILELNKQVRLLIKTLFSVLNFCTQTKTH